MPIADLPVDEPQTFRHHIRVEPLNIFKQGSHAPEPNQPRVETQSNSVLQQPRPALSKSRPDGMNNAVLSSLRETLDEAFLERDRATVQRLTMEQRHADENHEDSISTLKVDESKNGSDSPTSTTATTTSPATQEVNRIWNERSNKGSTRSASVRVAARSQAREHRPPARMKNYGDDSQSEAATTEIQGKMCRR